MPVSPPGVTYLPFQEEADMTAIRPTLCARCARQGKTCCQDREIYLTPGDRQRIRAYSGNEAFVEWSPTADPSYLDQDDDPLWRRHVFDHEGRRRILKRRPDGNCFFLDAQGCRLPFPSSKRAAGAGARSSPKWSWPPGT